jgi:hypothetical protein
MNEFIESTLGILKHHRVDFIVHGAIAMGVHGYPRNTRDLDVIVIASSDEIIEILNQYGFRKTKFQMTDTGLVYRFTLGNWLLDVFIEDNWREWRRIKRNSFITTLYGHRVRIISKNDLINRKLRRASFKDLADVHALRYMK